MSEPMEQTTDDHLEETQEFNADEVREALARSAP